MTGPAVLAPLAQTVRRELGTSLSRLALFLAVAAAGLLAISLPGMRQAEVNALGMLFAAPLTYPIAVVLAPLSAVLAIMSRRLRVAWVGVLVTVAVLRLPFALATDIPLYAWTYKHLGVVDYIAQHGQAAQEIDIYHSWPGLFAAAAWFGELTGAPAIDLAHVFSPPYHLAFVAAIYLLARSIGMPREAAVTAALVAELTNWVAQDYFAPQSVAFLLSIPVLALVVRSRHQPAAAWVALGIFAAITVTHQLTPFWLLGVVVLLTLLGKVRPRGVVFAYAAIAIGYMMLNYDVVTGFGSLLSFDAARNVQTNVLGAGSDGHRLNAFAGRTVAIVLWAGAALAVLRGLWFARRARRGDAWNSTLVAAAIAFSPFALLFAQDYGGEAVFRVMLYSLPGCALLVAAPLAAALTGDPAASAPFSTDVQPPARRRPGRFERPALAAIIVSIALLAAQASLGGWFANRVSPEAYSATNRILEQADTDILLLAPSPGMPGRVSGRYAEFVRIDPWFDVALWEWDGWRGESFDTAARTNGLTADLLEEERPAVIIITEQMKVYDDFYGMYPPGAIERFEKQLLTDDRWRILESSDTITVVELKGVG